VGVALSHPKCIAVSVQPFIVAQSHAKMRADHAASTAAERVTMTDTPDARRSIGTGLP
jgi:hypothetical protein